MVEDERYSAEEVDFIAPSTAEGQINNESLRVSYGNQLKQYKQVWDEIWKIKRRFQDGGQDPETRSHIAHLEDERHAIHWGLNESGKLLGKDGNDVLVDLLRYENNLEEYGLPEFSILKNTDIQDPEHEKSGRFVRLKVDAATRSVDPVLPASLATDQDPYSALGQDEVLLVYSISPIADSEEGGAVRQSDSVQRYQRGNELASRHGLRTRSFRDSSFHEASVDVWGVIVPKDNLEKCLSTIRKNPMELRLGQEFYQEDEPDGAKNPETDDSFDSSPDN